MRGGTTLSSTLFYGGATPGSSTGFAGGATPESLIGCSGGATHVILNWDAACSGDIPGG